MAKPGLINSYIAEAAVSPCRIVKFGSADGQVLLGAAVSDKCFGVSDPLGAAINDRCDVICTELADVEYGGTVTRGDRLTSDSTGRAVTAAPGAGVNNYIIGVAQVSGVVGDIGSVFIFPSVMQG